MDAIAVAIHLLNFVAPALFVAFVLALAGSLRPSSWQRGGHAGLGVCARFWRSLLCNTLAGGAALAASLVAFGHDGEIAGYALLVLAAGSSQWLLARGGRRTDPAMRSS